MKISNTFRWAFIALIFPLLLSFTSCNTIKDMLGMGTEDDNTMLLAAVLLQQTAAGASNAAPDVQIGGRLFDKWYKDGSFTGSFVLNTSGGPNGNGTLNDSGGSVISSSGHSYRCKNCHGWDLVGAAGVYGPAYQNKSYVVSNNLLSSSTPRAGLINTISAGTSNMPKYSDVLSAANIANLADFILAIRNKTVATPADTFSLNTTATKKTVMNSGGSTTAGKTIAGGQCANCHGANGWSIALDYSSNDGLSLGSMTRKAPYEAYFKILNGHPGSSPFMTRQTPNGASKAAQVQYVLDVFAGLCDTTTFPKFTVPGTYGGDLVNSTSDQQGVECSTAGYPN